MSYLFFGFALIIFGAWIHRAGRALKTLSRSPEITAAACKAPWIPVTILVPARNEEKNIGACLKSLLAQDYPDFEVLVINDNSSDKTEEILKQSGAVEIRREEAAAGREKLRYLNNTATPPEWTGKNFALDQGVRHARGRWLLFTDADTRHRPEGLASCLRYAEDRRLGLLSLLPECLTEGFCERVIQPSAMGFMGLWFPLERINNPQDPMVFGNGQYLLIRRDIYEKIGGHAAVRGEFLEDFALVRRAKAAGETAGIALGMRVFGTRMYGCLREIWRGWRRIYLHAFERRPVPLLWRAGSVFLCSCAPFLLFPILLSQAQEPMNAASLVLLGLAQIIMFGTAVKTHQIVRANRLYAVFHPVAALCLTLILMDAFRMAVTHEKTTWR